MRCGFGTCGLMIQTSGHSHGSLRYIEAIPHRVPPRFTTYSLGAPALTMSRVSVAGAAAAAWGAPLLPAARAAPGAGIGSRGGAGAAAAAWGAPLLPAASAASVAVIGSGSGAAVALPEAAGAGADEPSSDCLVWAQPPSTTPRIRQPAAKRAPST